jgi:hypothetical protein
LIVPGALVGLVIIFVPQSVCWLVKKGRDDEARVKLIWVRGGDLETMQAEFKEMVDNAHDEEVDWRSQVEAFHEKGKCEENHNNCQHATR